MVASSSSFTYLLYVQHRCSLLSSWDYIGQNLLIHQSTLRKCIFWSLNPALVLLCCCTSYTLEISVYISAEKSAGLAVASALGFCWSFALLLLFNAPNSSWTPIILMSWWCEWGRRWRRISAHFTCFYFMSIIVSSWVLRMLMRLATVVDSIIRRVYRLVFVILLCSDLSLYKCVSHISFVSFF